MNNRFKTLYRKPKTLTDRYDECQPDAIARLLAKPEAELNGNDFNMLFRAGVAPATYEEGLYFLPAAFVFLRRSPSADVVDCLADVMWFISEYAARLEGDGLLLDCREEILALLTQRTRQFGIIHSKRETHRQMGTNCDHYDYVEDSQVVCGTLRALLEFKTLRAWAEEFLNSLSRAEGDPVKSAWYLECMRDAGGWIFLQGNAGHSAANDAVGRLCAAMPQLDEVWGELQARGYVQERPTVLAPETYLLERHANVIRNSGDLFAKHPAYWANLFDTLGLQ